MFSRNWFFMIASACSAAAAPPGVAIVLDIDVSLAREPGAWSEHVADDHIFWTLDSTADTGIALYCRALVDAPIYAADPIAFSDVTAAAAGDRLLVSSNDQLGFVACDGTLEPLVMSPQPGVHALAYDDATATALWSTAPSATSDAMLYWHRDGITHAAALPDREPAEHAVVAGAAIYAATYDSLWRVDPITAATTRLGRASDLAAVFPDDPFVDEARTMPPEYSSGRLIADDGAALWSVREDNFLTGLDRAIVMAYPVDGSPPRLVVNEMWNTITFSVQAGTIYWREPDSEPTSHHPDSTSPPSLWIAPRAGGAPTYFRGDDIRIDAFVGSDVYGFYEQDEYRDEIRRVPAAELVAATPVGDPGS